MPTPPIKNETLIETLKAIEEHGSVAAAARALGINDRTLRSRRNKAVERGLHLSEGARRAVLNAGLSGREGKRGWIVNVDKETGSRESTYWDASHFGPQEQEEFIERLRTAFDDLNPAPLVKKPKATNADLMTLYPLFDVHFGMHAWGQETGQQDYDVKLATADMKAAVADVMAWTPDSEAAIVLVGGDFYHGDDQTNATPKSKHQLDVDGRHFKVLREGVDVVANTVEAVAAKHKKVIVRVLRGNHDEHSHMALTIGLAQRYRDHKRIEIDQSPRDIFMHQWGRAMVAAHHGDKVNPHDLKDYVADACEFWSYCKHRVIFTGHVHHDRARDFRGIKWESLRAFCPPDAYGSTFSPRRAMQAITFHKDRGIVLRAFDPIERQAA